MGGLAPPKKEQLTVPAPFRLEWRGLIGSRRRRRRRWSRFTADHAGQSVVSSWFRTPSGTHDQMSASLTFTCFLSLWASSLPRWLVCLLVITDFICSALPYGCCCCCCCCYYYIIIIVVINFVFSPLLFFFFIFCPELWCDEVECKTEIQCTNYEVRLRNFSGSTLVTVTSIPIKNEKFRFLPFYAKDGNFF
jgi:hypothetical protein